MYTGPLWHLKLHLQGSGLLHRVKQYLANFAGLAGIVNTFFARLIQSHVLTSLDLSVVCCWRISYCFPCPIQTGHWSYEHKEWKLVRRASERTITLRFHDMKTLSVLLPCVIHLTNDHLCRALPFSLLIFSNKLLNKWWSCRSLDTTTLMWRLWTETGIFQMSYVLLNRLCKYIQLIWGSNRTFKLNRILNWLNFIEMGSFWSVSLYIYIYNITPNESDAEIVDSIYRGFYMMASSKWKHFTRYWPFVRGIQRHRWIPLTKASDVELWCFLWSPPEQTVKQKSRCWWFETPSCSLWRHCNVVVSLCC